MNITNSEGLGLLIELVPKLESFEYSFPLVLLASAKLESESASSSSPDKSTLSSETEIFLIYFCDT